MSVNQAIILYALNLYSDGCHLLLNKTLGEGRPNFNHLNNISKWYEKVTRIHNMLTEIDLKSSWVIFCGFWKALHEVKQMFKGYWGKLFFFQILNYRKILGRRNKSWYASFSVSASFLISEKKGVWLPFWFYNLFLFIEHSGF